MKVISYCVYGTNPMYTVGMVKNLDLCKKYYPDWEIFIYVSSSVPKDLLQEYNKYTSHIYLVKDIDRGFFMNYRYLPLSQEGVERAIFRDADSRITEREVAAVEEWIKDDTELHIMKDHPYHDGVPILGGAWGAKSNRLKNMKEIIFKYFTNNADRNIDQFMLRDDIYPILKDSVTIHDEFFAKKPFPLPCKDGNFIGLQFDENDNIIYPEHVDIWKANH